MARGDHFFVWRNHNGLPYQHHVIDLGDGTVVHFTDGTGGAARPGSGSKQFQIQRTALRTVTRQDSDAIHVVDHAVRYSADEVVARALSQVGRRGYHLFFDNCEHFACWCVSGRDESRQVAAVCERIGAAGVKALATSALRAVKTVGMRRAVQAVSPWVLVADAAQWITEAGGHHVGLRDPQRRKRAGRAVGMATALGVGVCGGPAGMVLSGSVWAAGELAGELSRASYDHLRQRRHWANREPIRKGV